MGTLSKSKITGIVVIVVGLGAVYYGYKTFSS